MKNPTPLVINWHLTEACNYRCRYCYAIWNETACSREVIHDPKRSAALLGELYRFFKPGNRANPLTSQLAWKSVRLNLAGGEPLLHASKFQTIVSQARALGFEVSLISNGSYLHEELLDQLAPQLIWLGISIDSTCPSTNRSIGRVDRRGQLLDLDRLQARLQRARRISSGLRLKLNTVVNQLNHREDLSQLIRSFAPDKWKVLRMLPVVNLDLAVSDKQFASFLNRHSALAHILSAEDNQDMRESYLMIDPHGRFFQNSPLLAEQGYSYSQPILKVGAGAAFAEMPFNSKRFSTRYLRCEGKESA